MLSRSQAMRRLARGDLLRTEHRPEGRRWWFERPYAEIPESIATALPVEPLGDALIDGLSQSWRLATRVEG